jgi:hypothetical protein
VSNPTTPPRAYRSPAEHHRKGYMPQRHARLLATQRRAERSVETESELVPAICDGCGGVLGLTTPGEAICCRRCGVWAGPDVAGLGGSVRSEATG